MPFVSQCRSSELMNVRVPSDMLSGVVCVRAIYVESS